MVTVRALLETIPSIADRMPWKAAEAEPVEHQTRELVEEAATYEAAREVIFSSVPEGWRIVNVRVEH